MKLSSLIFRQRKKKKAKARPSKIFKPPLKKYFVFSFRSLLQLLVILLFVGLGFLIFQSDFFKIKFVNCQKEEFSCSTEEKELFSGALGKNIFLLDKESLEISAKLKNLAIESVVIRKKLPDRLLVELKTRQPVALLSTENASFLVDESGFVFSEKDSKDQGLPVIELADYQSIAIGEAVGEKINKALDLIEVLGDYFIPFDKLVIKENDSFLLHSSGYRAVFDSAKDFQNQVVSLQLILQSSKIKKKFAEIDLRFDKPVITFDE